MAVRVTLILSVILIILVIAVVAAGIIYEVTHPSLEPSHPFAPLGSIVQLRNMGTNQYLGVCSIGNTIACSGQNLSGDYATTSTNQTDPDYQKWIVNIDPDTQYIALQNVKTQQYLGPSIVDCANPAIVGEILSVQLQSISSYNSAPTESYNGWLGSTVVADGIVQLFVPDNINFDPGYVGTQAGNSFFNTCAFMVSDGFSSGQTNQTFWNFEIVG